MEKSKGLGDTIGKITKFTGIKAIVDAVVEDCGCQARQDWLNGKVPYDGKNVQRILKLFKK
jgi:arginyl-tRNA synthetase